MARLSIRLLGPFSVALDQEPVSDFESDKVRALLAYLATEPDRPHRREALAGLLWPERPERDARRNLRHALAKLRLSVDDGHGEANHLLISRKTIQFNSQSDVWCDVTVFCEIMGGLSPAEQSVPRLREAAALYTGPFLQGFSLPDSVLFGEWLVVKREQFQHRALSAMHRLALHYEVSGDRESALLYAWRQVELEPWREEAHQQVMRLLALNGQRGAALSQYEVCRRALADELRVAPARETTSLYEAIRDGIFATSNPVPDRVLPQVGEVSIAQPVSQANPIARRGRGRNYVVAVFVVLLVSLGALATFRPWERWQNEGAASGLSVAAELAEGKIVHLCEEELTQPQLCLFDFDSGQYSTLGSDFTFSYIAPFATWSPDGRRVVFAAGTDQESLAQTNYELYVIGVGGQGVERLTHNDANDLMPAWSPDGEWIAYHRGGELWLMRPDGSEPHRLLGRPLDICIGGLAWSPDSRRLAFLNASCGHNESSVPELGVIGRDGKGLSVVHSFDQAPVGGDLAWSPDGREILCLCIFSDSQEDLLLFSADGQGEPQPVDHAPLSWFGNFWPQWLEEA